MNAFNISALELRLSKIVHHINLTYKTNVSINYPNRNLSPGSVFLGVKNNNLVRPYTQNAGMYWQLNDLTDEQIESNILSSLGLLDAVKVTDSFKEKEMSQFDPQQQQTDMKEKAGRNTAEALLPFLRTDVPFTTVHRFASIVATWSGFGDSSAFTTGFMSVFFEYKEANTKLIEKTVKHVAESLGTPNLEDM